MIQKIAFLIILMSTSSIYGQSLSQNLIASSGDYFQNGTASLSWSIGEPIVNSFENGSLQLTQGFHQPYLSLSSANEIENNEISLYPNPTKAVLFIEISGTDTCFGQLYDVLGRKLLSFDITENDYQLDLSNLSAANYFIKIYNSGNYQVTTYKIQKIR